MLTLLFQYSDVSNALKDMDVGIIGVGITPGADKGKLEEIMTGGGKGRRGSDRKRPGAGGSGGGGGGSAVIIPGAGESIGDKVMKKLEETIAKGM